MKLCFIAGADSVHSVKWIRYFADKGHEVHWVSLTPSTEGNAGKVKLYLIKGVLPGKLNPLNLLFYAIRIRRLIAKIRPDIVHAHYAGVSGVMAVASGFHPFVLTVWGSDVLLAAKSKVKGPFVRFVLDKADAITCDAYHMRDAMIKLRVDPQK